MADGVEVALKEGRPHEGQRFTESGQACARSFLFEARLYVDTRGENGVLSWARPCSQVATVVQGGLRCWTLPHDCEERPHAFRCSLTSPWWPAMAPARRPL